MTIRGSDTALTGGRGTPNQWSPASDLQNWLQVNGTSVMTFLGNHLQWSGSTSSNVAFLGSHTVADVDITCRISNTTNGDQQGVVGRALSSQTFYVARRGSSNFYLTKVVNGNPAVDIVSVSISQSPGTPEWIRFRIRGSALYGKWWLDGQPEPKSWMLVAIDTDIQGAGQFGVRSKAANNTNVVKFDSFTAQDAPVLGLPAVIPPTYGYTVYVGATLSQLLPQQILDDMLGQVPSNSPVQLVLRYQDLWQYQETSLGVYNFARLDDCVRRCNDAGIRVMVHVSSPPSFRITTAWGGTTPNFASTADYAAYAQILAARYNGTSTNALTGQPQEPLYVDYIQMFNEDADLTFRDPSPLIYALMAAYPLVMAVHPTCQMLAGAVRKTPTQAQIHIATWIGIMCSLAQSNGFNLSKVKIDFHYYRDGSFNPDPTTANADVPNALQEIQIMQQTCASYGFYPQVVCLETGWTTHLNNPNSTKPTVSEQQQNDYIMSMYDAFVENGKGGMVLVYTIGPETVNLDAPKSITLHTPPNEYYQMAYYGIMARIAQMPFFSLSDAASQPTTVASGSVATSVASGNVATTVPSGNVMTTKGVG